MHNARDDPSGVFLGVSACLYILIPLNGIDQHGNRTRLPPLTRYLNYECIDLYCAMTLIFLDTISTHGSQDKFIFTSGVVLIPS